MMILMIKMIDTIMILMKRGKKRVMMLMIKYMTSKCLVGSPVPSNSTQGNLKI